MSASSTQSLKVAVLSGGNSDEREVSLRSGAGVAIALQEAGLNVIMLDPSDRRDLKQLLDGDFDVAFIALHGGAGEDGSIQGLLEAFDIPYTGSSVWSSATAMDKAKAKLFYKEAGVATPAGVETGGADEATVDHVAQTVGFPCMVKPVDGGSSIGLYRADDKGQLRQALQSLQTLEVTALVEQYIVGEVYTIGVVGNTELTALAAVWLDFEGECDYEAKYGNTGRLRHVCPAPNLDSAALSEVQELAKAAHLALECRNLSRSDFIRDAAGAFWILETNTLPGLTATSSLPIAAEVEGISYADLCVQLVELALEPA